MKKLAIVLGAAVLLLLITQAWTYYVSSVEEQPYEVIKTIENIEIRHYPPARMASVDLNPGESNVRNNGFRMLAGYIFGGNDEEKEFAMTAPVHMEYTASSDRMSFVLPEDAWNSDLPEPNDPNVQLHWSEDQVVAAIQYSGYSTAETYKTHKDRLVEVLTSNNIEYKDDFRLLGYDPPFKVSDRRNEIIVSVNVDTKNKLN